MPPKNKRKPFTIAHPPAVINAELELLPPANPGDLASIEMQIRDLQHHVNERTREYFNETIYHVVALGLYFLKAEAVHLLSSLPETVSGRSKRQDAKTGKLMPGEGFTAWLAEKFPETNERTARNYRNAARNAGLTADHTLEDVDRLREAKTLHEKKPTDLYRLKDKDAPEPEKPAAVNVVADVLRDTFAHLAAALAIKESMGADEYEAMWTRMKETLEAFTGASWEMQDTAATGEHAEVSARKPRAKAKSKVKAKLSTRKAKGKSAAKKGARK